MNKVQSFQFKRGGFFRGWGLILVILITVYFGWRIFQVLNAGLSRDRLICRNHLRLVQDTEPCKSDWNLKRWARSLHSWVGKPRSLAERDIIYPPLVEYREKGFRPKTCLWLGISLRRSRHRHSICSGSEEKKSRGRDQGIARHLMPAIP